MRDRFVFFLILVGGRGQFDSAKVRREKDFLKYLAHGGAFALGAELALRDRRLAAQIADGRIQSRHAAIHIVGASCERAGEFGYHDKSRERDCNRHPRDRLPEPDAQESRRPADCRRFAAVTPPF